MNRGSATGSNRDSQQKSCFNEAPIHESGKSVRPDYIIPTLNASMRPRFMNRGSIAIVAIVGHNRTASMRPRFMNRGSRRDARREVYALAVLQ